MSRARGNQSGQLYRCRDFWSGRFNVYVQRARGGEALVRKTVRLGSVDKLTREQAGVLLKKAAVDEQAKRDHLQFCGIAAAGPLQDLRTRQKGIISEMLVAVDLTRKGFEVYRHIGDLAPCDIVALLGDRVVRVEVKYGGATKRYVQCAGRFDILAVVSPDESIQYSIVGAISDDFRPAISALFLHNFSPEGSIAPTSPNGINEE